MSAQGLPAHILALFTPRWGRKWKAVGLKGKFQLAMTLRNVEGKHVAHRMSLLVFQHISECFQVDATTSIHGPALKKKNMSKNSIKSNSSFHKIISYFPTTRINISFATVTLIDFPQMKVTFSAPVSPVTLRVQIRTINIAFLDVRPPPQHLPPCVLKPSVKLSGCAEILGPKMGEGFACFGRPADLSSIRTLGFFPWNC